MVATSTTQGFPVARRAAKFVTRFAVNWTGEETRLIEKLMDLYGLEAKTEAVRLLIGSAHHWLAKDKRTLRCRVPETTADDRVFYATRLTQRESDRLEAIKDRIDAPNYAAALRWALWQEVKRLGLE